MKDKIIDKLTEYADAICDELNSNHDEIHKAFNFNNLLGSFDSLAQLLLEIDEDDYAFSKIYDKHKDILEQAQAICEKVYDKSGMENINENQEQLSAEFTTAIKELVSDDRALGNFECYLSYHFSEWLKKFANTPENITAEVKAFAKIYKE